MPRWRLNTKPGWALLYRLPPPPCLASRSEGRKKRSFNAVAIRGSLQSIIVSCDARGKECSVPTNFIGCLVGWFAVWVSRVGDNLAPNALSISKGYAHVYLKEKATIEEKKKSS
ncbi:hypothetical protein CEXT_615851 [Caerostris extrusa]|uniref:Uncharacterized protein n=1 Tax=Caerostris extrusa TaxID=172846 RepID=A0AAV4SKY1_CAEEX|nr:hypothetical protein CEXT_615851 [Caerostris extrusa]